MAFTTDTYVVSPLFFPGGDIPLGGEAAIIGTVQAEPPGMVFLRTDIGGMRVLDMLVGDPLPRIC
jgi:hydrogenase maturation factor